MNFPAEFFQDEYRCDFLVPELMKRCLGDRNRDFGSRDTDL